ncbi:RNA polymerase sigma-70 factor, ECF subfamily [Micromonospora pattaloongensis]|uniref:RNA polymerase sigma-70 factor, ECF subfamily n=1 Tax=Micromonospora pattaloongensis TaxID=405436 RepID=A0A1H3QSS3_9ACTN|nr:RNA polymerase sigma factor [Micromonospora pattaloongensis]SDZ16477.1 RNA polymerase sigma-70 factor, ECF subfamily [Micromonospora pattaloongensis]
MTADLSESVRAAQAGDEGAFRVLYRAVQPGLLRYLTALVDADAEDVASETWLQVARDLHTFDGRSGFRAWVVTIARNRALDHLRYRRRRPSLSVPVDALDHLAGGEDTAQRAHEALGTDNAIALIATLPRTEAEAVLLRAVVGLDADSAARVLGKRPGAVRTAAHRGLRRLAQMLERREAPGAPEPERTAASATARTVPPPRTPGTGR